MGKVFIFGMGGLISIGLLIFLIVGAAGALRLAAGWLRGINKKKGSEQ